MMVCMIVDYLNFIVEKFVKDTLIVPRAWSNSQARKISRTR